MISFPWLTLAKEHNQLILSSNVHGALAVSKLRISELRQLMKKHLVILSIPYIRVGRVLLGPVVLETIRTVADVLIVSPQAENSTFRTEFADKATRFFKIDNIPMQRLERYLSSITCIQRMNGYWFRYRNKGMAYYHRNTIYSMLDDGSGSTKKISFMKSLLYRIIAITGYFRSSWLIIDLIRGFLFRKTLELDTLTKDYEKVTLIQSCTWGEQDSYLAWYARR